VKTVRLRFTISGEYTAAVDNEVYGTEDPKGMAEVDQQNLEQDPGDFLADASLFKVEVVEVVE
jgi:hypothetical protein